MLIRLWVAAMWIALGKTSLLDCEALTWSLGWTVSPRSSLASEAITSLVFMLLEVPDPVWKTSIGNSSSCSFAATVAAASAIASALVLLEHAEPGVGLGGGALDQPERGDQGRIDRHARDREVLHRPLGLRLPQRLSRDPDLAHRVVLDPKVALRLVMAAQSVSGPGVDRAV